MSKVQPLRDIIRMRNILRKPRPTFWSGGVEPWALPFNWQLLIHLPVTCHNCHEVLPSEQTYLLHGTKVIREWAGSIPVTYTLHPHIPRLGEWVCLGDLPPDQVAVALTSAFNPASQYRSTETWFRDVMAHECEDGLVCCEDCNSRFEEDSEDWHGWSDLLDRAVCGDCFTESTTSCYHCDGVYHNDSDYISFVEGIGDVCDGCLADKYFLCCICENWHNQRYLQGEIAHTEVRGLRGEPICNDCYGHEGYVDCSDCEDICDKESAIVYGEDGIIFCPVCAPTETEEENTNG